MRRRSAALLHVGYWALYLALVAFVLATLRAPTPAWLRLGLVLVAPNVVAFYGGYGVLFPRLIAAQRFGAALAWGATGAVAIAATTATSCPTSRSRQFFSDKWSIGSVPSSSSTNWSPTRCIDRACCSAGCCCC